MPRNSNKLISKKLSAPFKLCAYEREPRCSRVERIYVYIYIYNVYIIYIFFPYNAAM